MGVRLDTLNAMLRTAGEFSTDTELDSHPEIATCKDILDERRKEELSAGWWFNKRVLTLMPDGNGDITIPASTLAIDATDKSINVSFSGNKLYDEDNLTYTFTSGVEVELIIDIDEDNIPPVAMAVIKWLSVIEYAGISQITGQPIIIARENLEMAKVKLVAERYRKTDTNFNNNAYARKLKSFDLVLGQRTAFRRR